MSQRVAQLGVLLPGLFGLLGAGIDGGATYLASIRQAQAETERQELHETAEVRGIARLLISEYDDAQVYLSGTLDAGATQPIDADIEIELSQEANNGSPRGCCLASGRG